MKLNNLKANFTHFAGRSSLVVRKYSPEILIGVGVAGIVTSTVMACKATLKSERLVDEARLKFDNIKEARELVTEAEYSKADEARDVAVVYIQSAYEFTKLYGPAIFVGGLSVACIIGSNRILKKRNLALVAAYKAIEKGFKEYRDRVIEEFGEEKDYDLRHGVKREIVKTKEVDPETGKTKTVSKSEVVGIGEPSVYAKFFDEYSINWSKTPDMNLMFLRAQQNYANDILKSRGHLFLNEVYDMLGLKHTTAGAIVGWVLSEGGDNYVDFNIYDEENERARAFVNGDERSILLDFNVDGVIYDLI